MDITTTKNYALLYGNLIEMAHSAVRELDPQNKLQFIRSGINNTKLLWPLLENLLLLSFNRL